MALAAAVQFTSALYNGDANRARAREAIRGAAASGARLIVLPELAVSGYGLDSEGLRKASEPLQGPTLSDWAGLAAELDIWIVGGFCEHEGDRLYNTAILVGPEGLTGHYRKLHLFDREKLIFEPGDKGLPIVETPLGRVGLCVCYDLRFVEVTRALALQGADVIAVPTAWVGGFDPNPRDVMGFIGQARGAMVQANLNQVYMVCASQGDRAGDIRFLGSSMIIDPYGEVQAGPLSEHAAATIIADIDPERLASARIRSELVRPREDRRTDMYAIVIGGQTY